MSNIKIDLKNFFLLNHGIHSTWKKDFEEHMIELNNNTKDIRKLEICIYYLGYVYDMININDEYFELMMNTLVECSYKLHYVFTNFKNTNVKTCYYIRLFNINIKQYISSKEYYRILSSLLFSSDLKRSISKMVSNTSSQTISTRFKHLWTDTDNLFEQVVNELKDLFYSNFQDLYLSSSIADILHMKNIPEGRQFIQLLRMRDFNNDNHSKNIYQDTQNVHNSHINKRLLSVSCRLIETIGSNDVNIDEIIKELNSPYVDEISKETIKRYFDSSILDRIQNDNTLFSYNYTENQNQEPKNSCIVYFNLYTILANVWKFITKSSHKEELKQIFVNEMKTSNNVCPSGCLARLVSVIQGFSEDELLKIGISNYENVKVKLFSVLNNLLKEMDSDLLLEMSNDDNSNFVKELLKLLNLEEIFVNDEIDYVNALKVVINYCKNDDIILIDKQLFYFDRNDFIEQEKIDDGCVIMTIEEYEKINEEMKMSEVFN